MADKAELQALGERVLASQAFSQLLGTELVSLEEGKAELRLAIRDDFLQQHGRVHGGVISYLADNALTFAGGSLFGDGLTLEYKVNYLKAAGGTALVARAAVDSPGRQVAVCSCRIHALAEDGTETLCALAQGTIMAPSA